MSDRGVRILSFDRERKGYDFGRRYFSKNDNACAMPELRHLDRWQPKGGKKKPVSKRSSAVRWFITATLLGAAIATGLTLFYPMLPSRDNVSASEVSQRQAEFRQSAGLKLDELPAQQTSLAIEQLPLDASQKAALSKAVSQPAGGAESAQSTQMKLAQITLWDTHQQDGDIVAISSGTFRIEVPLTKAPQTVAVPVDATGQLLIAGVRDGGGGITLGIRSADSALLMPIMSEGQTLNLPLR